VHIVDGQPQQLEAASAYINDLRTTLKSANPEQPGQIITHPIDELKTAVEDSWLVLECVPERLALKREVLANVESIAPSDTLIASNSSSYTITEIIETLELKHEKRVLSAHSCE
jgi:3-hydroxyacyl-CoA dehydrogenase